MSKDISYMEFARENNPFRSNSSGKSGRVYLSISRTDLEGFLEESEGEVVTFMGTARGGKSSGYAVVPDVWLGQIGCKSEPKYVKG